MKKPPIDPCDLPILARRGEADAAELRRLQMHHAASPFEHELYTLGTEYDAAAPEQPGDAALLNKLVGRTLRKAEPTRLRHRTVPLTSLLGVLALAGVAAAALTLPARLLPRSNATLTPPPAALPPTPTPAVPLTPTPAVTPTPAASSPASSLCTLPAAPEPSVAAHAPEPALAVATAAPVASAGELFAGANSLRKTGQSEAAIKGYQVLQSRYPSSPEASLSRVLLARMHARRGAHAQAEHHYARYLASGGGELTEESLLGRSEALRALGRTREAKSTLHSLLTRFPRSIYAEPARQRLKELD